MKTLKPITEYTIGFTVWMVAYVAALFFAGYYFRGMTPLGAPQAPLLYAIALLPSIPIGGTILVFLRFMDRSDEYMRSLMTRRFIVATGITLFISTAWGFVRNYTETPGSGLDYSYMIFWLSFAVSCTFVRDSKVRAA